MPYTPPAAQSPVASKPQSPALSRTHSYSKDEHLHNGILSPGRRSSYPHASSSYLTKHRRSPSTTQTPSTAELPTSNVNTTNKSLDGSVDQDVSPLLKNDDLDRFDPSISSTPSISPPSPPEDGDTEARGRKREVTNLKELQAAIRIIEQHRAGSPDGQANEETEKTRTALGLPFPKLDLEKAKSASDSNSSHIPLSAGARKISHSRSTTAASAFFDFPRNKFDSPEPSASTSDDDDIEDDELRIKPALIRKKSGELVRPALRPPSAKRRPSSMPGTPTYSKAVHFQDQSLEHVRHFLQVDKPIAVSAGTSPVDSGDDDADFPFGGDGQGSDTLWEIRLTNFPRSSVGRQVLPVRTEEVYLSTDTKILHGRVAVRNLAFHKLVVARFTLDYWKTTSEVVAEYSDEMRKEWTNDGCDRFVFSIKLEDQANLENKTMFFCVRYNVNGQDFWDNNNSINYQVEFAKGSSYQKGMPAQRPVNAIPRNKTSTTPFPRPRSMPSFDDFANMASPYEFTSFPKPSTLVGESPIRFKNKTSASDLLADTSAKPKSSANQAFGNRYDFGASLSAAIQAASTPTGSPQEGTLSVSANTEAQAGSGTTVSSDAPKHAQTGSGQSRAQDVPKPAALTSKTSLSSASYHELLDKYCFFGSGKSTSQLAKSSLTQFDGTSDYKLESENGSGLSSGSSSPSPGSNSPVVEEKQSPPRVSSPRASRSVSPRSVSPTAGSAIGQRTSSPAFGYPYHQHLQGGLFETHAPTAIRG